MEPSTPKPTRAALTETTSALVYAGEHDYAPTPRQAGELAALFPRGELVVQPAAGHFPCLDDPAWFVEGSRASSPRSRRNHTWLVIETRAHGR